MGRVARSAAVNFEFSSEQELLRESVRGFVADRASIAVHVRPMLDDERGCDATVWAGLADLGLLGLLAPAGITGTAPDLVTAGVALEEIGHGLLPEPYIASAIAAVTALSVGGGADDGVLADIASGSRIATVAIHEPGHRYDWNRPDTTAEASGDGWRLTGSKVGVLSAMAADVFVVSARVGSDLGLFLVHRADLGADALTPEESVDGTRKNGRLALADTPSRPLTDGDATEHLQRIVDVVAVALAVDGVGAASAVLDLTVAYATERRQFGVPIGSFQAVQHLCADMLRDLEITRAGAYYALWACQAADAAERHRAAVMAKAYASEVLPLIGESAIQVFGGIGFTWEHDAHLFYKRMLSAATLFGNADQQYDELADLIIP
jgi:alkylation response protein AidB-like acyl-CoA dehydrogenase